MDRFDLAKKIKKHRNDLKLSLDELAEKTDSSKSYIWELENPRPNKREIKPSAEKISRISLALKVSSDYLLDHNLKISDDNIKQEAFFRSFKQLDDEDQKKVHDLIDMWRKK